MTTIKTCNGTNVDTSVSNIEVRDTWSSDHAQNLGFPADRVQVILRTEAVRADGTRYPFVFNVYEHKKTKSAVTKLTKLLRQEFAAFAA